MDEDLTEIKFTVPGEPFGKQRPRVVRRGSFSSTYTPKETVTYENYVKVMFQEVAKGRRFADSAMLDVRLVAYFGIPKSTSQKKRGLMLEGVIRPTKKPDSDNIAKAICDSLNGIAYHDDSAVVDMQIRKFYSETPRVVVKIQQVLKSAEG